MSDKFYYRRKRAKEQKQQSLAKEVLVKRWTGLVHAVVIRTAARAGWFRPTEDHFAAGMLGLMNAITKYDGTFETKFATHVYNCVRYEVMHEIKSSTWFPACSVPAKLPKSRILRLDELNIPQDAGDWDNNSPPRKTFGREAADALAQEDSSIETLIRKEALHKAIDRLPEKQRDAVICCDLLGMSQEEVGEMDGVSQPTIQMRRKLGHAAIKEMLRKEGWE